MTSRLTNILPLLLLTLLCVGVVEGGYKVLEYFVLRVPSENAVMLDKSSVEKKTPDKYEQKKKNNYQTILQRNLFGPPPGQNDTKATAATPDYAENLQSTSLNIVLMGTVNGGGGADRAIILDKSTRKQELYEQGDAIQGAVVKEILRGKVILAYNGTDEVLDMSDAEKERSAYALPVAKTGTVPRVPRSRSAVSPKGTPRRVINRSRVIRPSRSIRTQ
jgi:type II secretory pathway component PulC